MITKEDISDLLITADSDIVLSEVTALVKLLDIIQPEDKDYVKVTVISNDSIYLILGGSQQYVIDCFNNTIHTVDNKKYMFTQTFSGYIDTNRIYEIKTIDVSV